MLPADGGLATARLLAWQLQTAPGSTGMVHEKQRGVHVIARDPEAVKRAASW